MDTGSIHYEQYLSGDDRGMEKIIREYRDGLIWFLSGIVGNPTVAEDLAEDTFVLLCTKKPKDRQKSGFKTWLYTIGRNLALSYLRKSRKHLTTELEETVPAEDDAERYYVREEEKRQIYRAINRLYPDYRTVLRLIYFEDLPREEVAMILKKNRHNLDVLLSRARIALKNELKKEGFEQ